VNVGLPGTGIGALFYALSVLIMLSIEVGRLALGRSSSIRLRLSLRLGAMLSGVVLSLVLVDRLLAAIVAASGAYSTAYVASNGLIIVLATLVSVVGAANIAGVVMAARDHRRSRVAEAEG
jgi:hypothetical protein